MSVVKVIDSRFPFPQDLTGLIKYIFNDDETAGSYRYLRHLIFVSPDIVDVQAPGRIQRMVELICHNHKLWNVPSGRSIVHHMVVSFADAEINNPNNAWWLGVQISQEYTRSADHADTGRGTAEAEIEFTFHVCSSRTGWQADDAFIISRDVGMCKQKKSRPNQETSVRIGYSLY